MNNSSNTAGHRSLYEVTGDIKDINTLLVPRAALASPAQPKKDFSEVDFLLSWFNENDGFSQGTKAPHKWVLQTHAELIRLRATLAAPAPDMTDAYAGAREDLSIWKKRALEAEALNRKFAASVNSPSFMGEPAAPVDADTERLNWLERHSDGFYNLDRISSIVGKGFLTGPFTLGLQTNHATLREAIDAACAAQKEAND